MTAVIAQDGGRRKFVWEGLETLTLDACQRPLAWAYGGKLYRRGLDGQVVEIDREPDPRFKMHNSRRLTPHEAHKLLDVWAERLKFEPSWHSGVREDEQRFTRLIRRVSILPPDQYRALVLQPVTGCAWNRCRFCDLYRDRKYTVMSAPRFSEHLESMVDYFGPALEWRRGIFLGDANVGGVSQRQLVPLLEVLRSRFPCALKDESGRGRHPLAFERVSGFFDTFTGAGRPTHHWEELRELGLSFLHMGVESGNDALVKMLGKPSTADKVRARVEQLKEAGLNVSLIFILGAGGRPAAEAHERDTISLVNSLPLDSSDRIYLSELLVHPGGDYEALRLDPLSRQECREQGVRLRESFETSALVSLYDVRQFVYH